MHLTLTEALTPELERGIAGGDLDLAVVSHPRPPTDTEHVHYEPLLDDEYLVALPLRHPGATGPGPLPLAELADANWVEGHVALANDVLTHACAVAGFTPRIDVRAGEWTAKLGFVAAGLGVTLVPRLYAPAARPDVVLRTLCSPTPRRSVSLAQPAPDQRAPATKALTSLLRAHSRSPEHASSTSSPRHHPGRHSRGDDGTDGD